MLSSDSNQITISHISNEIWQYKIGSYEVINKWLKQRKKDKVQLTLSDINHIMNMAAIINATIQLQERITNLSLPT